MAVRTISTRLAVEGEAEYKQKIASCNSELKTLKSSLALVQSEYKNNANSMEALTAKGEALSAMQTAQAKKVAELEKALENCQKAQTAYADRVAAAEANVSKYEQALAELKDSTGDTSEEQAALTAELEKWKEELANAEAGQTAAERGVENWQQQLNKAKIELNETNEAISENDKYLDEAKKSTDGCATSIDKFGNKVKGSKDGITQLAAALAAAGVAKSVKEIADALMECSQAAAGFETALAKVSTLADTSVVSMDTIKAQLVSLSGETGVAVESLAEATYQALSAGVDTANVVDFVSTATKLSVAGFTESATAVDVVTTALNAYGLAGSDAEKVASMLVKTQDLGKTSVGELAATMGRVIPTAAAYNVSLDQLSASYAIITASGTNTAIATTNLGAMFNELASEGGTVATILEEQTGKSFAELMADGASLGDVISILSDSVDGNSTAFSNLWSSTTAGQAALTLLNQGSEKFNDTLVKMQNSSGAVERNFETMADTTEFAQQRMTTASENLKIAIGDQLNPALEKLYSVGADAFTWATDFVNENPWLVKAITAVTVGIGTLAAGVTLAANAANIAAVAQGVLNAVMAANPAFLVAAGVTALVAAIGTFILTLDNADEETRAFTESLQETKSAYEELSDSMAEEQATTAATADSLQSLLEVEEKSAAQKAAIAEMVAQLNEDVPNLGLAYDAATDSINMTTEALDALVEHAADQEEYEAQVARLSELYTEQAEITARLEEAQAALAEAQETGSGNTRTLQNNIDELTTALEDNQAQIAALEEESAEFGAWQEKSAQATEEMTSTVNGLISEMEALQTAYEESHAKAVESIEGQLGLFNDLDGTAKTSIDSLIETLKGQVSYMETYAANIQKAMELGVDEGLVKKLADGSEESAQILAAIVEGGEDEIAALNEQLAKVEDGKNAFGDTVAEMETDFSEKMADIEKRMKDCADELDVSVEAGAAGAATIEGYIEGAESMRSSLVSTYRSLARAANNAYKSTLDIHSPSRVFRDDGRNTILGAIEGGEDMRSQLEQTYESLAKSAIRAYERAQPKGTEADAVAAQQRQTAAVVAAATEKAGGGGLTYQFHIEKMEVRDDQDVERVAQELYYMTEREKRSRGGGSL